MVKGIGQFLRSIQGGTVKLFLIAGVLLLGWGMLSPVGTLVWWVNQSTDLGNKRNGLKRLSANQADNQAKLSKITCYIIYLPGVGDYSANQLTSGEELFLKNLVQQNPECVVVSDVFPYSASNESLGGRRVLAPMWTEIEQADGWLENADVLIKIRNLWRFAISADDRYGPVFNRGIAQAVVDRMDAAHPISRQPQQPLKLVLIGTSGGAQVALGTVPYLKEWLQANIYVISVGGDFSGETGFEQTEHVYHLQGKRDWIDDLSRIVFPSRWPWVVGSPFNRAKRAGRFTIHNTGPHAHDGDQGYFGIDRVESGKSTYVQLTLDQVEQLPLWSK